ncbi:phage distal tail protein [Clostridium gasigenes]|uniref:Phage tail protein n=1 Tax=Clostridium gasigenes TaxID=94869 RepID=A0A1H0M8K8_9CLOT|nr:phage tail domain-containing protein [Clostridium gasigenes]MBB6622230.1 phage tail family protein [Clostridium gasigenes]SDO76697.1 Phage tail protein [Clostridium gasigenes]
MIIDIINKRTNKQVTLESYVYESGVLITSFSQGNIPATFNKVKGVNQYGSSLLSSSLEERNIEIQAIILGNDRMEVQSLQRNIDDVLNPLDELIIKCTDKSINKEITGNLDGTPIYSEDYKTNNDYSLSFKASFECFNPFWRDQNETAYNIETWEDGVEFELELNSLGIEFARRGINEIEIINYGNIEAPLEIFFKGPALNPTIILKDKFIKINKIIADNETLYIRTAFGNKAVEVIREDGRYQAYHYIDVDSSFFDLDAGRNLISYSTEGDYLPQSVVIKYKCHYFGL